MGAALMTGDVTPTGFAMSLVDFTMGVIFLLGARQAARAG